MQCKSCGSDNVQKLSLVYEQGTQNIKTTGRTYGSGVGVGRGGIGAGFGSARTTTTGKSQSLAAKKAAPPEKKPIALAIGVIVIGLFIAIAIDAVAVGLIAVAIGGFLFWTFYRYNKNTFPPLYAEWDKSWLCNKCGAVYVQ
jgi:hypothetical protein